MAVGIAPTQKGANAAGSQSNAGIRGAVIEIDRISVCRDSIAAWEYDILDVSVSLVVSLRRKHPRISAHQTFFRPLEIEERQTQPVDGTRRRPSDAVINHQPASGGFNRWRGHAILVCFPPAPPPA